MDYENSSPQNAPLDSATMRTISIARVHTLLSSLTIRNSNITSLDLSSATKLLFLIVDRNELERLDVSPCKSLTYLDCSFNRIADTGALTTWLAQPGHSGTCLPQNV